MGTPRRVWSGIALPADLHAQLCARCGHRQLTATVADAIEGLISSADDLPTARPSRQHGTVEMSVRLPLRVADAADSWRTEQGLSRQATVEYAVLRALRVTV